MPDLTITAADSPIPNAVDQYYAALRALFEPTSKQNIALNSTLVTFDIVKNAPLYNEGVFRSFADRTIGLSPTEFGPGAANVADRFSERYSEMISRLLSTADLRLSEKDRDAIVNHRREISLLETQLVSAYTEMSDRWNAEKARTGLKDEDPTLLDKMVAFFNTFAFATKLRSIRDEILGHYESIRFIRLNAYPSDAMKELATLHRYAEADQYKVVRPIDPRLEAQHGYDHIKLAQLWVYGNIGGTFDIGQELRASGFLENFLSLKGQRGFSISKGSTSQETHDARWKTKATATKWFFFRVSVEIEHQNKWQRTINKTNKVELSFENMAEYWVNRGRWFSSTIFDHQVVKDYLKQNPLLARDLSYAITSVVLGRGLKVALTFDSTDEFERWHTLNVHASANFRIFGINLPGGASDYNQHDWKKTVDTERKTVTFEDDPEHCRLLGFRVEKLFDFEESDRIREFLSVPEIEVEEASLAGLGVGAANGRKRVYSLRDLQQSGSFVR